MSNSNLSKLNSSGYPESLVVQTLQAASSLRGCLKRGVGGKKSSQEIS
jgi:hypothetical protein